MIYHDRWMLRQSRRRGHRIASYLASMEPNRDRLLRRGLWLNHVSIGYNVLEAAVALGAGLVAGSVALTGFGFDSLIEVTASVAARWRLRADLDHDRRDRVELRTQHAIGWSFLALAAYVAVDSAKALWHADIPERSVVGVALLTLSLAVMPALARAKRRVALRLDSAALIAEAMQTSLCAWLSAIALVGVGLNAWVGWWWADPLAALVMVPIIAREGRDGLRGRACGHDGGC